jgi:hypothetical protein
MQIKLMLFLLLTILLSGCYRNFEVYEFKSTENHYDWGVVGAKLIGNKQLQGNTIIESSPYELLIWFDSKKLPNKVSGIKNIKLIYADSRKTAFQKENIHSSKTTAIKRSKYFSFKNIELKYKKIICSITFLYESKNKTTELKTDIILETDFKKFKRIIGV